MVASAAAADGVVRFDGITKAFVPRKQRPVHALQNVAFDVQQDEFVAIVGPSGCGKSTLLNLCAGLSFPERGQVVFRGTPVTQINTRVGYITQDSDLLPWLTVLENVALPLEVKRRPPGERDAVARAWIARVGLAGFEQHYPRQLSGGMQKRCAIARTLVQDPDVILMDEPFGPLDAITRLVLQDELLRLWAARKKTIVFVTHDLTEAISLADRVVVMTRRPGRVKAILPVEIPRPRDVFHVAETPAFAEIHARLWDVFAAEIETGTSVDGGTDGDDA